MKKGVERLSRFKNKMEIAQMVKDTQAFTNRVRELLGPQALEDAGTLVAELCRTVGVLAEGLLVTEGKRPPRPGTSVRLGHDIADVLYMLVEISNHYHVDLELAWNDTLQEGWANLVELENRRAGTKND